MVLESITTPERAEKRPVDLFFIGAMYGAVAIFLSIWVFKEEASIIMVLLTVIACMPLVYNTLRYEEEKDTAIDSERILIKEHGKALKFFMCLFVGFVIAYSIAFIFLPENLVTNYIFDAQINTISQINARVAEGATGSAFSIESARLFLQILSNNIKVLLFCIFFAFFYGAGAIFILTWNASVISAAIGMFFRNNISEYATNIGLAKIGGYFHIYSLSLARYFIHGLPEILSYFIGGLAGGIISEAVIRHDFGSKNFKHVVVDSVDLIILVLFVLFVAAVIEVYITPQFF